MLALLACLLAGFATASARAASVGDLYRASAPIAGHGPEDRNNAIKDALGSVLVKVTGSRAILERKETKRVLESAPSMVREFSVEMDPGPGGAAGERRLVVRFAEGVVNSALREAGIPIWGGIRPALLVWIATEDGGPSRLATPDEQPWVWEAAEEVCTERGLPLVVPLFDLEDRNGVRPGDLAGGYSDVVRLASARYAPDVILLGALKSKGEQWGARWILTQAGSEVDWSTTGDSPQSVVAAGIHWAGDQIATRFAPSSANQARSRVRLDVSGVHASADYGRTMDYLRSLDIVENVLVLRLDDSRIALQLDVRGGEPVLRQTVALGTVLDPEDQSAAGSGARAERDGLPNKAAESDSGSPVLNYRLRP